MKGAYSFKDVFVSKYNCIINIPSYLNVLYLQPVDSFLLCVSDVPLWLKSLRLHKYAYLFQQLAYEDMMKINEDWLETQVR